jgi:Neuraminidase (sialidase)
MLPKTCSILESVCSLWELHGKEALNLQAKEGSRLLYFKRDDDNSNNGEGKGSIISGKRSETVREVDNVALTLSSKKRQLDEVFQ